MAGEKARTVTQPGMHAVRAERVLVADPDPEIVRRLSDGLRGAGFRVVAVSDGSRALEAAVLNHPDIVLFEENNLLVDVAKFVEILRSNPRTEHIQADRAAPSQMA